jgi:hypothetical protein
VEGAELHGLALPMEGEMEHVAHYLLLPRPDTITESYLLGVHLACGAAAFRGIGAVGSQRRLAQTPPLPYGLFSSSSRDLGHLFTASYRSPT